MTNSDRLQEIRERVEKATPGPWEVESALFPSIESADGTMRIYDEGGHGYKDAIFIAEARSDIPYLLQLVTEQQRGLELVSEVFDWFYPSGPRERVGDESTVCAVCFNEQCATDCAWRQAAEYFTPPEPTAGNEAKGYRKQERPI